MILFCSKISTTFFVASTISVFSNCVFGSVAKSEKDVEKIYMLRKKIYSLADYEVDCLNKSRDQIVNNIKNIYENI